MRNARAKSFRDCLRQQGESILISAWWLMSDHLLHGKKWLEIGKCDDLAGSFL